MQITLILKDSYVAAARATDFSAPELKALKDVFDRYGLQAEAVFQDANDKFANVFVLSGGDGDAKRILADIIACAQVETAYVPPERHLLSGFESRLQQVFSRFDNLQAEDRAGFDAEWNKVLKASDQKAQELLARMDAAKKENPVAPAAPAKANALLDAFRRLRKKAELRLEKAQNVHQARTLEQALAVTRFDIHSQPVLREQAAKSGLAAGIDAALQAARMQVNALNGGVKLDDIKDEVRFVKGEASAIFAKARDLYKAVAANAAQREQETAQRYAAQTAPVKKAAVKAVKAAAARPYYHDIH